MLTSPLLVQASRPRLLPVAPVSVAFSTPSVLPHSPAMRPRRSDKVPSAMTMLAQRANHRRSGTVELFPKRGIFQENGPHPPTAPAGKRKCRTGQSARRVRGPQCHPRVRRWGAEAVAHRQRCRGPLREENRGRATIHPHRRGTHSPMRRPALGRNPGRVEEKAGGLGCLAPRYFLSGVSASSLSISSLIQRERLGAHHHSDQIDTGAVTDPEQQGRRAGDPERLAYGDAAPDPFGVLAAVEAFLEGFDLESDGLGVRQPASPAPAPAGLRTTCRACPSTGLARPAQCPASTARTARLPPSTGPRSR